MSVPFIDIGRFEPDFQPRWIAKVQAMTAKTQFIGGEEVATLERNLASLLEVKYAVGCANGTDAIQLALRAVDVGAGDKVVVPNATFWATFEAVVNVGATPVTVDISLEDGGIDFEAFKLALDEARPKAAVVAHLYGWGTRHLVALRTLCTERGVALIEDGAQCFGATFQDKPVLAGALVSTTSFYPAKVLGAAGDAGAVFTDDADIADRVRRLGNHGRLTHYSYGAVGWNSRLDALQAAFLNLSMDYLDARIASRRDSAAAYRRRLPAALKPVSPPQGYVENGYCNVCLIDDSEAKATLEAALKQAGIGFGNIYPGAMSDQPGGDPYRGPHFGGSNAQRLSRSVLNLPLFPYMREEELQEVLDVVQGVVGR